MRLLFASERFVLVLVLFTFFLCAALGAEVHPHKLWLLYSGQLITVAYGYTFMQLVIFIGFLAWHGGAAKKGGTANSEEEAWRSFRREYFNVRSVVTDLRLIHTIMVVLVAFAQLKHLIPTVNPALFDAELLAFERWLLGGRVAFEVFDTFIPRAWVEAISAGYRAYYVYLSALVFMMVLQRKHNLSDEFCVAFGLLWFVGILIIYILPTWGPCFFVPEIYSVLPQSRMTEMQGYLWEMKLQIDAFSGSPDAAFAISGLPSLHLAVAVLGSYYLRKIHVALAAASWIFAAVTVVSTLYFGWHYILDDVAAVLLAAMVIPLAKIYIAGINRERA